MRYAMDFHAHEGAPSGPMDVSATTADSLASAERAFLNFARRWGTIARIENGGSWADLYAADQWDGISYGEPIIRLKFGAGGRIEQSPF
jgi:hypothetical protein